MSTPAYLSKCLINHPSAHSNLSISFQFGTTPSPAMDWFSWLSRTSLEPSLIYDYGLTFARNELQLEDAIYFNHEFLQSMGISIAKHRLEILKLVKKEEAVRPRKLSGVIKKCLRKCMNKLVFHEHDVKKKDMPLPQVQLQPAPLQEPNWHQGKWKGALVSKHGSEEVNLKEEKPPPVPMYRSKSIALSGPLDGTRMHMQEKMVSTKALKLSGPLDGKMHERMMFTNRSPLISRPMEGRFSASTKSPRTSGPLDPRVVVENRSPRLIRPFDATRAETESPMGGRSPYNKPRDVLDFDIDDDHALWPSLFQDLKPT